MSYEGPRNIAVLFLCSAGCVKNDLRLRDVLQSPLDKWKPYIAFDGLWKLATSDFCLRRSRASYDRFAR